MLDKPPRQRLVGPQALVAIASIVVLLATLCVLAVVRSGALTTMLVVVEGLGAATIILFRQLRKTTQSLIASEARAQHLAQHDGLTGLPNRVRFLGRLGEELDRLRRVPGFVGVISVGIDQYNQVKDAFGYRCADELMEEAARRLAGLRDASAMVGRIGADEFALIETDAERLDGLVAQARELISRPFALSTESVFVTCSVGVSAVIDQPTDPDDLLRQADIALRKSREDGRSGVRLYEPAMDRALQTRKAVEADLRSALANGELTMVYQPQVGVGGVIVGVEALAQWYHRELGEIPPSYFISLAEESDLIFELGRFTIDRVLADARRWRTLKVAVNVSVRQLACPDFVSETAALLSDSGVEPSRLEVEITEGVLLGRDHQVQRSLQSLRDLGLTLALDGFGVGYSSLNYLMRHSIDKIKIDRSFVAPLGGDASVDAVVGAMLKLGDALNLRVVAEGVETEAQKNRLVQLGCKEFQGGLISAPLPAEVIDALALARTALAA
ncbi:MAG: putative bifunctional diguanylate cyclase/phosphodiesterase [Caulobacterales bacterium]